MIPTLTDWATRSLKRTLGDEAVTTSRLLTVAEDFAYIARAVPSVYCWVGVTPADRRIRRLRRTTTRTSFTSTKRHCPGLVLAPCSDLAVDYLQSPPPGPASK